METPLVPFLPVVGSRVWTSTGFVHTGAVLHPGPPVEVAPSTGGTVVGSRQPYGYGAALYDVRWDTGQTTTHYGARLFCLGPYRTPAELEAAIRIGMSEARVTEGPQGGFRGFVAKLVVEGQTREIRLFQHSVGIWRDWLQPLLAKLGIPIHTDRISRASAEPRRPQKRP